MAKAGAAEGAENDERATSVGGAGPGPLPANAELGPTGVAATPGPGPPRLFEFPVEPSQNSESDAGGCDGGQPGCPQGERQLGFYMVHDVATAGQG